jgi:hypothetical protein
MGIQLSIGKVLPPIGWNTANRLEDTGACGEKMRCEAFGYDWAVFRSVSGQSFAIAFKDHENLKSFLNSWED